MSARRHSCRPSFIAADLKTGQHNGTSLFLFPLPSSPSAAIRTRVAFDDPSPAVCNHHEPPVGKPPIGSMTGHECAREPLRLKRVRIVIPTEAAHTAAPCKDPREMPAKLPSMELPRSVNVRDLSHKASAKRANLRHCRLCKPSPCTQINYRTRNGDFSALQPNSPVGEA